MMKFSMVFGAALAAVTLSAPASAVVVFDLSNVQLVDGGQLTGTLTTSDDLSTLLDFSITSTSNSSVYGTFVGITYTLGDAWVSTWNPAQGLVAQFLTPLAQLNLFVASPLTALGAPLAITTSETQIVGGGGTRWATSGELVAQQSAIVPEPAAWAMMIAGFGLVGVGLRRRSASGLQSRNA